MINLFEWKQFDKESLVFANDREHIFGMVFDKVSHNEIIN